MLKALHKVPAYEQSIEPLVAQNLLIENRLTEALPLAEKAIYSVKEKAPLHAHFTKITLLIEAGAHQEALEASVSLKEALTKDGTHPLLFAHNLLRIALLHKALGNVPGEKASWHDFESFVTRDPEAEQFVAELFAEQKTNWRQFLAHRRQSLNRYYTIYEK
jgi:hypothetical protein